MLSQVNWFAPYRGGETILRAVCSSALWQIYQTLYLLFRMQKCRFTTPQDAGMIVLSMGDGILICLRSLDPTAFLNLRFLFV
jgi:hypothetical protein